jgi:hypothetical protein
MPEMPDGTSGQVLTAQGPGVDPVYAPAAGGYTEYCKVRHSVAQSIPDITYTIVAFDTEDADTDNMHDPVTNNSRITIQTAGRYLFIARGQLQAAIADKIIYWQILKNGTTLVMASKWTPSVATSPHLFVVALDDAIVGDYYEARIYHNYGVAIDLESDNATHPSFQAIRVQ